MWAAGVVVVVSSAANLSVEREAYVATTAHADYAIEADTDGARHLRINGQNASREDGAGTGHPYVEWIEDRVYAKPPEGSPAREAHVDGGEGVAQPAGDRAVRAARLGDARGWLWQAMSAAALSASARRATTRGCMLAPSTDPWKSSSKAMTRWRLSRKTAAKTSFARPRSCATT